MSDNQNTIPDPSNAEEAQALIKELRERFDLGQPVLEVRDVQRMVRNDLASARARRPAEVAEFVARHVDVLVENLVPAGNYARSELGGRISELVQDGIYEETGFVLDQLTDPGWTAEVIVERPGEAASVVDAGQGLDSALVARERAYQKASEVARGPQDSVSIRMALPSVLLTLNEKIS